jgi:hypothetical protein
MFDLLAMILHSPQTDEQICSAARLNKTKNILTTENLQRAYIRIFSTLVSCLYLA